MTQPTLTLTDRRFFRRPEDRDEFFQRVMRSNSAAATRPPFLHRLGFSRRKSNPAPTHETKDP